VEAWYGTKHTTSRGGDNVHLTETCEDDAPHLITPVETTARPVSHGAATPHRHQARARQGLVPATPSVETGYLAAERLVTSPRESRVERLGPMRADGQWQAQAAPGFAVSHFPIDGEPQQATCPGGYPSLSWTPAVADRTHEVVKRKVSMKDGQPCASRVHGPRATRRTITGRRQDHHVAWPAARARATSLAYTTEEARRAGMEGTRSHGIRAYGLWHARSSGEATPPLQHVVPAAAINVGRMGNWLRQKPLAKTRTSAVHQRITHPVCC
jgi:DDE family transposase